jgi:hypothetical protein
LVKKSGLRFVSKSGCLNAPKYSQQQQKLCI